MQKKLVAFQPRLKLSAGALMKQQKQPERAVMWLCLIILILR
jgi:hypothetical protein